MATVVSERLATPAHMLAALVFTDIVGSTQLKTQLRSAYFSLLERHNELFETSLGELGSGEVIKHTGDGYFASFPTASDAVRFGLLFQSRMNSEPWAPEKLQVRLGIHIGEVMLIDMAGRKDIVGLSADIAARLMSLAVGGQILLTEAAFNDARQYVNSMPEVAGNSTPLIWMAHGRYLFKGADEPLEVYEVGVEKIFPLHPPADSEKAKRAVPHDQESTLGWRPAKGLAVPGRPGWQLVRKLGDGGFGEVWLGEHQKLLELRCFKFCFDPEKLLSLKREFMLFRLLREALGRRPDIAALYEVRLDEPPFFLESEYSAGGNLLDWAEGQGGITKLPLAERLEILAKVADALAAAHSVGVLHKDVKPSNILIQQEPDGQVSPRLADFGIGAISDRSRLKAHNVTDAGFTELDNLTASNSIGTRMYAPPECMSNTPFTSLGDIYALGVMLYQMAVGDLMRPLATGWERDIDDEIMRGDIAAIVEGDPARRVAAASEVARLLRTQNARRQELTQQRKRAATTQRRKRVRRLLMIVGTVAIVVLSSDVIYVTLTAKRIEAERKKAQDAVEFLASFIRAADPGISDNGKASTEKLIFDASKRVDTILPGDSESSGELQLAFGDALRNYGNPEAESHYDKAAQIYTSLYGAGDRRTLLAQWGKGAAELASNTPDAQKILKSVWEQDKSAFGEDERDTLQAELYYGATVYLLSGPADAQGIFADALNRRRNTFADDDKDTIQSISAFATVERDLGDLDEAKKAAKTALDWRVAHLGEANVITLPSMQNYGMILLDLGQPDQAEVYISKVLQRRKELSAGMTPTRDLLKALIAFGDVETALKNYPAAEDAYKEAIYGFAPDQQRDIMPAKVGYAEMLTAAGRAGEAEPLAKEAAAYYAANPKRNPRLTVRAEYVYAMVLQKLGKPGAQDQFQAAANNAKAMFLPDSPLIAKYSMHP